MPTTDQDHLLDHCYDGIQEFDNPLPGWWVAVFWATIIISLVYPVPYHVRPGHSIFSEYNAEATAAMQVQADKLAAMEVNEDVLLEIMGQPEVMSTMARKFRTRCASCHDTQGQGDACPNLTDDYWVHGGSLVSIFETIRDGIEGKEMQSWLAELGPGGCLQMAAYIGTLRGRNVPGKGPEGKLYEPPTNEAKKVSTQ